MHTFDQGKQYWNRKAILHILQHSDLGEHLQNIFTFFNDGLDDENDNDCRFVERFFSNCIPALLV